MKQNEIEIGGEYLTRIGGKLARVVVLASVERGTIAGYGSSLNSPRTLTRFRVARVDDSGKREALPKARAASALHKPSLDPFEASLSRALKADPARKPELQAQFLTYRFLLTVGCPKGA